VKSRTAGAQSALSPGRRDFRPVRALSRPGSTRWPGPRPICSAASKSAGPATRSWSPAGRHAGKGGVSFPRRAQGLSEASLARSAGSREEIFAGKTERPGGHGSVEWAVTWYGGDGFNQLLLQHHSDPRRRHPRGRPADALLRGSRPMRADRQQARLRSSPPMT
jgi:hypothetical protein